VAAGTFHSLAVLVDGSLWAWGNNQFGQLGDGTNSDRAQPTKIGDGFVQVAAGDYFSLARKADGSVFAWGRNNEGQLGDGSTTNRTTPTALPGRFSHITASAAASLAQDPVGGLYHWGRTLGISSSPMQLTPNRIALGVKGISAGEQHLLVQKLDDSLYAVGSNEDGELGVEDLAASESAILVKVLIIRPALVANIPADRCHGKAYAWGTTARGPGRDDRLGAGITGNGVSQRH
jgi:alpha-tubulin suppressor-like RCC1 family protein